MKQHANAALTVASRKQVKSLFENQQLSIAELARRFQVHRDTVRKWIYRDSPFDKPSAERKKRIITPEYESAVIEYRRQNLKVLPSLSDNNTLKYFILSSF